MQPRHPVTGQFIAIAKAMGQKDSGVQLPGGANPVIPRPGDDERIQRLRRDRTGNLAPENEQQKVSDEIQSEPWNSEPVHDWHYNGEKDKVEPFTRKPSEEERFDRMKDARQTFDIPTPSKDMDRIRAIQKARQNAKR